VYHGNASANVSTTWGGSVFQGDDKQYYMAMAEMVCRPLHQLILLLERHFAVEQLELRRQAPC